MKIGKYSFGVGDRFSHEGVAQLQALLKAEKEFGVSFVPVWNKSNREHQIVNTVPMETRREADAAVKALGYKGQYFVDADHINLNNVDKFIDASDFFTIDVADYIGKPADPKSVDAFVKSNARFIGKVTIPGIKEPLNVTESQVRAIANRYLFACQEAGRIYRHIAEQKGADNFVTEVSMDEVNDPQTPVEILFILSALSSEKVPVQTIAPKFTGRFNKGVDYRGDLKQFEKEFEEDLLVIDFCVKEFGMNDNLKLSIHSGSDKFSIYPIMGRLIKKYNKGIHIKTAGTTWLEENIGLAISDGEGLNLAKEVYATAYEHLDELTAPYASVIDIKLERLPKPEVVNGWTATQFANAIVHNQNCGEYNADLRQLIHVGYKVAAQKGKIYYDALEKYEPNIEKQVLENIFERHMKRLK